MTVNRWEKISAESQRRGTREKIPATPRLPVSAINFLLSGTLSECESLGEDKRRVAEAQGRERRSLRLRVSPSLRLISYSPAQ